jgi:hypothetical protein
VNLYTFALFLTTVQLHVLSVQDGNFKGDQGGTTVRDVQGEPLLGHKQKEEESAGKRTAGLPSDPERLALRIKSIQEMKVRAWW